MAFGKNIQFVLGQGGIQSPVPGNDYISGMLFTNASSIPTGFSYSIAQEIFSLSQAVSLGIVGDYSGETKPVGKINITATASPAVGTVITINVTEPNINNTTNVVNLSTYTVQATDTTPSVLSTSLLNSINIGGSGYTAGSATGTTFSVTGRPGIGTLIGGASMVVTGVSASVTIFSGGVADPRVAENYQISEFFRNNPTGILWVMYQASAGTWTNLNLMQSQASNAIRQFGVYSSTATSSANIISDINNINAVCNTMFNNYAPASVIYAPNIYGVSDLSTLGNLTALNCPYVSCVIGQDGGNLGAYLSLYLGASVICYGAVLGELSSARVSDSIGWVGKYNISNGTELSVPALGNTLLYANEYANAYNLLNQLDGYGYSFIMTRPNIDGTFVSNTRTSISTTSDYSYIERVRTIDKVVRNSYLELVPLVNSPLLLNADGTISSVAVAIFQNSEKPSLDSMIVNQEISAYKIIIDPSQNVQSTGQIAVVIEIVGIGVARNILVTIGYTLAI